MNIKTASELTGLPSKTIKYYEEEGLITPRRNEVNNYRYYSDEDIFQLNRIKLLRKLNFSVNAIRNLLNDPNSIEEIFKEHLVEIDETIKTQKLIKSFIANMLSDLKTAEEFNLLGYLNKITSLEDEGVKFMDENLKESKFKKDSKITFLMLLGYILIIASSVGLLILEFINNLTFLIILATFLILLIIRHSNTTGYVCGKCGARFNITPLRDFISPHTATSKYLKCPNCSKRSWAKESYRP